MWSPHHHSPRFFATLGFGCRRGSRSGPSSNLHDRHQVKEKNRETWQQVSLWHASLLHDPAACPWHVDSKALIFIFGEEGKRRSSMVATHHSLSLVSPYPHSLSPHASSSLAPCHPLLHTISISFPIVKSLSSFPKALITFLSSLHSLCLGTSPYACITCSSHQPFWSRLGPYQSLDLSSEIDITIIGRGGRSVRK